MLRAKAETYFFLWRANRSKFWCYISSVEKPNTLKHRRAYGNNESVSSCSVCHEFLYNFSCRHCVSTVLRHITMIAMEFSHWTTLVEMDWNFIPAWNLQNYFLDDMFSLFVKLVMILLKYLSEFKPCDTFLAVQIGSWGCVIKYFLLSKYVSFRELETSF